MIKIIMKKIISLSLLLCLSILNYSQTVTISDIQNKGIEGAILMSNNPKATVITNKLGEANITSLQNAEEIHIHSLGYHPQVLSFSEIQNADFHIILELSLMELEEVVVSATKWKQTTGNIPSKISTISTQDISVENPQTAADLLGISGKVFIQKSQQGGGSPMIRGFATNRLIYTVDGVRMNTAIFRSGNIQNVINLDPFATESTEILFGPGSVIYGSDAIGGVMSFQSLTPQLSMSDKTMVTGKANTRFSSANKEKSGHFDVNIGWKKWALVSSFSYWDYDNLRQGSNGPEDYIKDYYVQRIDSIDMIIHQNDPLLQIPTAYSQKNIMQKIRFKPNENWDIQYGFHYSETSPYGRYDRHNRIKNGTARYSEWNYGNQSWMMNNLSVNHQANHAMYDQMNIRLAYQLFEESRIDRAFNSIERNTNTENVDAWSANFDFNKQTGIKNAVLYGIEYVLNDVTSTGKLTDITTNSSITGAARYPNSTWQSIAIYVNDEYAVSNKLTFQTGLRYNQFNLSADFSNNLDFYPFPFEAAEIDNAALTGSFGGVYKPNETWAIKANLGTAFRSPNVDDIGKIFDSEPGAVVVPNPDVTAEYAYNGDFGIAKVFGDRLKIDIAAYYTLLKNALVRRDFQLNGQDSIIYDGMMSKVQAVQNAANAHVYGIQAGFEYKFMNGFSVQSDINFQYGEEELDNGSISPSRHAAPLFGISKLKYQKEDLVLEFYAVYQGERSHEEMPEEEKGKDEIYALDSNGNTYSPAWYTLNIKAMYDISKSFRLSAGIENLTDQRYRAYSSGISGAGRNFFMSVQYRF
jgi:hemoglobin/transferrin/lactoferrin receptor protein